MDMMKTSMNDDVVQRAVYYLDNYWDVLAEILGIHVPDEADGSMFVSASVIADFMGGRELRDPGSRVQDYVASDGRMLSCDTQNKIATVALSMLPFWGGYHTVPAKNVFGRVIKHATGDELERIRQEIRDMAEAVHAEKAATAEDTQG